MFLRQVLLVGLAFANFSRPCRLNAAEDDCPRTSKMHVYSSAFIHKETGDLLGYELALGTSSASTTTDALLFIHEGSPGEAIPLTGQISGGQLIIEGDWIEHLIEYSSKKEIVQTHSIRIIGTLDERWFRGTIAIEGLSTPEKIQLKRVRQIWMCRSKRAVVTPKN